MERRILLTIFFVCTIVFIHAQDLGAYGKKWYINSGDTLPYRLLLPEHYDPSKKYPLIVFLHGSGERGRDNEKQLVHGARFFLNKEFRNTHQAIVVFPQCPATSRWSNYRISDSGGKRVFTLLSEDPPTPQMILLEKWISQLRSEFRIDKKRIIVGGLSMGGMGTFELTRRNPKLFAAAFPICGATDPSTAKKLRKIDWWIFHGAKDDLVPPASSIQMAEALKKAGADVRFSLYPEANHNSWDPAFAEPELAAWLFSRRK